MAEIERGQELDTLNQQLKKGQVYPLYLLYGEEEFQRSRAMERLQQHVLKGIPVDFNFNQFYAKEVEIQRVLDTANLYPMMAPRRLVILRNVEELKEGALDKLSKYTEKPSPTTVFVMVGEKVDGRKKFVQQTKKQGLALEFKTLYDRQLKGWLKVEVRELNKTMAEDVLTAFIDLVGDNLRELHSELQKVSLYVGNRGSITLDDLKAVISDVSLDDVFDLSDAIGAKDAGRAVMQLRRMYDMDPETHAQKLIPPLYRYLTQLYRARLAMQHGTSPAELKPLMLSAGVNERMYWKWEKETLPLVQKRSLAELERQVRRIYEAQVELRTRRAPDEVQLEALLLDLCR
ncbi:MAG: DNA polymerase III subunit delta [Myxococcota bacterium]